MKSLDDIQKEYFNGHNVKSLTHDEYVKNFTIKLRNYQFWYRLLASDVDFRYFLEPWYSKRYFKCIRNFTLLFVHELLFHLIFRFIRTDNQFVFLVGMPHSGTTLVQRILNSNPSLHGTDSELNSYFIDHYLMPDSVAECLSYPEEKVLRIKRRIAFRALGLKSIFTGRKILFNKNPLNILNIHNLQKFGDSTKIIVMKRDATENVYSLINSLPIGAEKQDRLVSINQRADRFPQPRPREHNKLMEDDIVLQYVNLFRYTDDYLSQFSGLHFICFEELGDDIKVAFQDMCSHIGISYDFKFDLKPIVVKRQHEDVILHQKIKEKFCIYT